MSKPDSDSGEHTAEVDELVEPYLEMAEQGSAPAIDEYARSFPQHASELRRILETMNVVQKLRPPPSRTAKMRASSVEAAPVIEDYRLIRVAGRGGMGVVYEAIQISLDRKVALKVLPQVLFQNQRARQRFQLEAKAAAQLHHSNIVPVHGVGIHNEHCYYAMQFIEGDTLDHVISQLRSLRDRPEDASRLGLPATRSYAIAKQMLEADPKNMELMMGVAQSLSDLGDIQNTLGDSQAASQSYNLACEQCEELYAAYPQSNAVRKMLCFSLTMVGQKRRDLGQYDQAIVAFERAKHVAEPYAGDAESGVYFLDWVHQMDDQIEETIDRRESGHPPEYWSEPPPGWTEQEPE